MIIFLTFSFAGNVLFDHRVRQFSTGLYAMQTYINMLFGEFDYRCISDIRGSGFFYWGYMLVLTIVLLNMMLAIVTSTYEAMSNDGVKGEISVLLTTRISWIPRNMVTPLGPKHPSLTRPSEDDKRVVPISTDTKSTYASLNTMMLCYTGKSVRCSFRGSFQINGSYCARRQRRKVGIPQLCAQFH